MPLEIFSRRFDVSKWAASDDHIALMQMKHISLKFGDGSQSSVCSSRLSLSILRFRVDRDMYLV